MRRPRRRPPAARLLPATGCCGAPLTGAARGGGGRAGRTSAGEAWRWHLLQTPDDAREFHFAQRRRGGGSGQDPSAVAEAPEAWWQARDWQFEEEGLFCNGRWLGVQVLQGPEDLLYFQQVLVRLRPQIVIETGTYRGGLAFFAASIFSQVGLEHSRVVTVDTFDMESNFHNLDNNPLCPVCHDCVKAHETELWRRHVVFFQGNSLRLAEDVRKYVEEARRPVARGPVLVTLDAQHSYDGTLIELHLYAGLADVGSYVVLQDARLDATYGRAGPLAAGARLLEAGQWLWDREVEAFGHSQHLWLRRLAEGPPVGLSFEALSQDLVTWSPFRLLHDGVQCAGGARDQQMEIVGEPPVDSALACQALCLRVPNGACRFVSFSRLALRCVLRRRCTRFEPAAEAAVYERRA